MDTKRAETLLTAAASVVDVWRHYSTQILHTAVADSPIIPGSRECSHITKF